MCAGEPDLAVDSVDSSFPNHGHICLLYDRESDKRNAISRFVESGLRSGRRVVCLTDTEEPAQVLEWLTAAGVAIPVGAHMEISRAEEVYCEQNVFDPEAMLARVKTFIAMADLQDVRGLRICGEMSWAARGTPGADRLIEYESRVNHVLAGQEVTALCQYDTNLFDGAALFELLAMHPLLAVRGHVFRNPYFAPNRTSIGSLHTEE